MHVTGIVRCRCVFVSQFLLSDVCVSLVLAFKIFFHPRKACTVSKWKNILPILIPYETSIPSSFFTPTVVGAEHNLPPKLLFQSDPPPLSIAVNRKAFQ